MTMVDEIKSIAIGTLKGGTGKTSFLFNLGGVLAEKGKHVLFIDGDPQFNLTTNMGIDVTRGDIKTIKDIFESRISASKVIYKSPIPELTTLDIIPSSILLTSTEIRLVNLAGREQKINNFFLDNKSYLEYYDYIFMDTNPNLGIINQNIFFAADSIILISDIDVNSIQGAEFFIALWEEMRNDLRKSDNVLGLVLNNADKRSSLPNQLIDYCKENEGIGRLLIKNVIPSSIIIKNASLKHMPFNVLKVESKEKVAKQKLLDCFESIILELEKRGI